MDELIEMLRGLHQPKGRKPPKKCRTCGVAWPCETSRMIDAYDDQNRVTPRLRELLLERFGTGRDE